MTTRKYSVSSDRLSSAPRLVCFCDLQRFNIDVMVFFAGGVNQGDLYVCSIVNGTSQRIPAHRDDVNCVAFADQSSQILYSGSDDGVIKVWDRRNLSEQNPRPCGLFVGHKHGITYVSGMN